MNPVIRSVTLPLATTPVNLYTALKALYPQLNKMCHEVFIKTMGAAIYVGDASMGASDTPYTILYDAASGTNITFQMKQEVANIDISGIWLRPSTNGLIAQVLVYTT